MATYRSRGLERRFPARGDAAKVLVVEGARATGKTRLMQHLVSLGRLRTYTDLSDPTVRTAAEADLEGWLRSLAVPAVIDEAQLLAELPLAVKRVIDSRDQALQFVLTGSSSIGRSGLAGADPLAGRAERLVLRTFTEAERRGLRSDEPSVVDRLFGGEPRTSASVTEVDEAELLERIERGGLPEFALGTGDRVQRAARIRDDVLDALGRELDPNDRFDALRVRDTLDALVRAPGRIVNTVKLGEALGLDRRTVDRYLAVLERRFLIVRLPNLAMSPIGQAVSRSKAHPFDTAIAAESLRRAGVDLRADRERFGQILESWVVQQVTSAATWSRVAVESYYWRQSQRPFSEVDLVLVDDQGRTVGIEVKASHEIRAADASGLRAIAAARGLHRGYIVYLGSAIVSLGNDIWALPISLLDSAEGLPMPSPQPPHDGPIPRPTASDPVDATLFLSYVHADDEFLGGAMLRFAEALQASYRFQYGREIRVFTDRTDLAWGAAWQRQLDEAARDTQFLLAMLTPSYLRSDACRREFEQFLAASAGARDELVLAVRWTPLPPATGQDPVRAHVDAHQWEDARDLADLEPGTPAYRAAVGGIARRLHEVVERREAEPYGGPDEPLGEYESDLIEEMLLFNEIRPRFETAADRFGVAMGAIGTTFEEADPLGDLDPSASAASLARLGQQLQEPTGKLVSANAELTATWRELDRVFARLLSVAPALADEQQRADLRRIVVELRVSLDLPGLVEMEAMAGLLGAVSRHLRPTARALQEALRVIRTMQQAADDWRSQL